MKIRNMTLCAMFTALFAICAWMSIPMPGVAFTLQTFALFLTLGLLGGKRGSVVTVVYLLLGAIGLPVFSGFQGGISILLGATGGYILGFLAASLAYWLVTSGFGTKPAVQLAAMMLGLFVCYLFGSLWYWLLYLNSGSAALTAILLQCVLPYIVPDLCKLILAFFLAQRLYKYV